MMKNIFFLIFTSITVLLSAQKKSNTYQELWEEVYKEELNLLPKSALEKVNKIDELAKKEHNEEQEIKCLLYQSKFAMRLEEDAQLKIIQNFNSAILNAKSKMRKAILNNMLAHLYWDYYNRNRWEIHNRTNIENEKKSNDFKTWNLDRLLLEIHKLFQESLTNTTETQNTTIKKYQEIIKVQENNQDTSVYEFLVYNALDFYNDSRSSLTKPKEPFVINNKKYIVELETLKLTSSDSTSSKFQSLKLYQSLIKFHKSKNNLTSYFKTLFAAVDYIESKGSIDDGKQIVSNFYQNLTNDYPQKENTLLLYLKIAQSYYQLKEYTNAVDLCHQLITSFPKAESTVEIKKLKDVIEKQKLRITLEKNIPILKKSKVLLTYRNVKKASFKLVKLNDKVSDSLSKYRYRDNENKNIFLKNLSGIKNWTVDLKDVGDYLEHQTEVVIPELESGRYLLIGSSANKEFAYQEFQVTDLVLIKKSNGIFQVLNRDKGNVIPGAKVHFTTGSNRRKRVNKKYETNENGEFIYSTKNYNYGITAKITTKLDTAVFENIVIDGDKKYNGNDDEEIIIKPFVFTDRSIYRPGQTVYFKAVLIQKKGDKTIPFTKEYVELIVEDANGDEVKEFNLKLNEYGTVSGEFKIPKNGLTGEYNFEFDESIKYKSAFYDDEDFEFGYHRHSISVEEYKRPKFETSFQPVKGMYKLNDTVTVIGKATALAGSNITNAKVNYRVVRKFRYPRWCWWLPMSFDEQEITHGETTTLADGTYKVPFKAVPDLSIDTKNQPVFYYTVYADVTDLNGETRSTETEVKVGYQSINLSLTIAQEIDIASNETEVHIDTENLNGEFVGAKGVLKIYKLKAPDFTQVDRPWMKPDFSIILESEYKKMFPHHVFENTSDPKKWNKGDLVYQKEFNTAKEQTLILKGFKKWKIGSYQVVATLQETKEISVKDEVVVRFIDKKSNKVADNKIFQILLDQPNYSPNDEVVFSVGSAAKDLTVFLEIEKQNKIVSKQIIHLNNEIKTIKIPVTEKDRGGFCVNWYWVNKNSFKSGETFVPVIRKSTQLKIETLTFRDVLEPGAKQKWSFKISGTDKEKVSAEILASMFDVSLDQFIPHAWNFNPVNPTIYRSGNRTSSMSSFNKAHFDVHRNSYRSYNSFIKLSVSKFNMFGFSFVGNRWINKNYLREISYVQSSHKKLKDDSVDKGMVKITVLDAETSDILPGVVVKHQKNEHVNSVSDFNGIAFIKAKKGSLLEIHYLGFKTHVLKVDKKYNHYIVRLSPDHNSLDEIFVVGYGSQKKDSVTAAVSKIGVGDALQGRVAGVQIDDVEEVVLEEKNSLSGSLEIEKIEQQLDNIQLRTNFNETAFFFPQLRTNKKGEVSFEFTMPEDLTRWKLQLLAHDKELNTAVKTLTTVTQKQLMVIPNTPRFLREGDEITLSTKIANLTEDVLKGQVKLELTDAVTGKNIDGLLQNNKASQNFYVDKKGNTSASWALQIPENVSAVQYKIVATANDFSDGEQNVIPVLSNRMLVTETLPLWVNGGQSKTFTLNGLKNNTSTTLKNHQLSLEITTNPAWYAVQALPYLMEYPYECAEQTFARFYANQLASHIVNSNPKIKEVFTQWATSSETLVNNFEKNPELKSIIIQETPWLRDAQSETEQKKRIALLFDLSKMESNLESTIKKLENLQMSNGGFPWFKGSTYANRYITQHIVQGYYHLTKLGVTQEHKKIEKVIAKAQQYLDIQLIENYEYLLKRANEIKKKAKTEKEGIKLAQEFLANKHVNSFELQYLYVFSFDLNRKLSKKLKTTIDYYNNQAQEFWKEESLYNKGLLALIHYRNKEEELTKNIMKSLKETSILNDEMGRYWKENQSGWSWYQDPIVTQSLLIELFSEVEENTLMVDELKQWLLKNKQVQQWKSTKATSEAIYALLLQGSDWLSVNENININIGGKSIPESKLKDIQVEAGTGYFKTSWKANEITNSLGQVTLTKKDKGFAWGGLYWQYFEDLDKIKQAETPLKIKKEVFLKKNTDNGVVLALVKPTTKLEVGDLLTIRIELSTDRTMDFIHMKDMRAAGLEPIDVISKYKWQDGLGYYQSTKDTATHFFFDNIRKGIYVFEYDLRVSHKGVFSNGITNIESMYAPEFSSHSKGVKIEVE